jgi:hypothetical protein
MADWIRVSFFLLGATCIAWCFKIEATPFALVTALILIAASLRPDPRLGPLAASLAVLDFAFFHLIDATLCILLATALQPPLESSSRWLAPVAWCWLWALGTLVERIYPCTPETPTVYLLGGAVTGPLALAYLTRLIGQKRALRFAFGSALTLWALSGLVPKVKIGALECSQCQHDLCGDLEAYASNHHGQYPRRLPDLIPEFRAHLPECPNSPDGFHYESATHPDSFTVSCVGPHRGWRHARNGGWIYTSEAGGRDLP